MPETPDSRLDTLPDIGDIAPILDALARRGHPVAEVRAMVGDVSRRRYFRLRLAGRPGGGPADGTGGGPAVLAVYPDEMLDTCRRYLAAGELLAGHGVRVAEVMDSDCQGGWGAGWVLLEDFGERTLYEHAGRRWPDLGLYFEAAVDAIGRIAALPAGEVAELNPPLDGALLRRELAQTRECFFEPLGLDERLDGPEAEELRAALDTVCRRLAEEAPVPCHRDFGARNLMPLASGAVGVLDHQDLRLGPPAYDLASLLNDSLFPPPDLEERLLGRAGCPDGGCARESYHRAAAQRTLKAVGSYAAFARRGSDRHLGLIPPTLGRALRHLERLPEAARLAAPLAAAWKPALDGEDLERLVGTLC